MKFQILAAGIIGGLLSTAALADPGGLGGMGPAAPAPAPAPAPTPGMPAMGAPPAGGMLNSVSLASIKAIFDQANVPADILQLDTNFSAVHTTLGGNEMIAVPVDCQNDNQAGTCATVVLLSAQWRVNMTPQQVVDYSRKVQQFSTVILSTQSAPQLRYIFQVKDGVGPDFVAGTIVNFANDMKGFSQALSSGKAPGSLAKLDKMSGPKTEKFSIEGTKVEITAAAKSKGTGLYVEP